MDDGHSHHQLGVNLVGFHAIIFTVCKQYPGIDYSSARIPCKIVYSKIFENDSSNQKQELLIVYLTL